VTGPQWGPEWGPDGEEVNTSSPEYVSPQAQEYERERLAALAERGEVDAAREHLADIDPEVQEAALGHWGDLAELVEAGIAARLAAERGDVDAVGEFIDVDLAHRAASQRESRARDAVAEVYGPVRRLDREAETAHRTLADVAGAEAAAGEWTEALQQQRDAVRANVMDRQEAGGKGPKARAAAQRLEASGSRRVELLNQVQAAQQRAQEAAEKVGTMDPARWRELQEQAGATLAAHSEVRQQLVDQASQRTPELVQAQEAARAAATEALGRREAAGRELQARGLDVDRVSEVALRMTTERREREQGDQRTEAALAGWEQRQQEARPAGPVVEEGQRGPEVGGNQLER